MILLPTTRQRIARVPFLFRSHECLDTTGLYALSYGQRVYATLTRTGAATMPDQDGRLVRVPGGMPRIAQVLSGTTRVPALLLENAITNLVLRSEEFDHASWAKSGVTVTPNATRAPDGTLTMDLLTAATTSSFLSQQVSFGGSGERVVSVWFRPGTAVQSDIFLYDQTAAVTRHQIRVTVTGGIPALATVTGSGTLFPVEYHFASRSWRLVASVGGVVAANSNSVGIYPDRTIGTANAHFWGFQAEDSVTPGSYVPTGGATASQGAEAASFPLLLPPQEMTVLYAGIEIGLRKACQAFSGSYHLWTITNAAAANPKLKMNCFSGNGRYQFQRTLAAGTNLTAAVNSDVAQPDHGEAFKLRGTLLAAGNLTAGIMAASESGETTGLDATTSPLEAAWGGQLLYLNQDGGGTQRYRTATRALAVAVGSMSMSDLADLCEVG